MITAHIADGLTVETVQNFLFTLALDVQAEMKSAPLFKKVYHKTLRMLVEVDEAGATIRQSHPTRFNAAPDGSGCFALMRGKTVSAVAASPNPRASCIPGTRAQGTFACVFMLFAVAGVRA